MRRADEIRRILFGICAGVLSLAALSAVSRDTGLAQESCAAELCYESDDGTAECGNIQLEISGSQMTITGSGTLNIGDEGPVDSDGNTYYSASDWSTVRSSITNIIVDDFGVEKIGSYAFSEFSAVTYIYIGRGVTSIGSNAFPDCLTAAYLSCTVKDISSDAISYNTAVKVASGSYAQTYAKNQGLWYDVVEDDMHAAAISGVKSSYTYSGKVLKPKLKLTLDGKTLKPGTDYTVTYKNNIKPGRASIIIKGKGNYGGKCVKTFIISPKKSTVSKVVSSKKKSVRVTWRRDKLVTGYQVQIASNSAFSKKRTVVIRKNSTTAKTFTKLTKGKKYYVRVRAYKKVGSKAYYGAWSKVKAVRCK